VPRVAVGAGLFVKEKFFDASVLHRVDDIEFTEGPKGTSGRIAMAGRSGAAFLDIDGGIFEVVDFRSHKWYDQICGRGPGPCLPKFRLLDLEGDGVFEYVTRSDSLAPTMLLLDHTGVPLWAFAPSRPRPSQYSAIPLDLNHDNRMDFVVLNWPKVTALDRDRNVLWENELPEKSSEFNTHAILAPTNALGERRIVTFEETTFGGPYRIAEWDLDGTLRSTQTKSMKSEEFRIVEYGDSEREYIFCKDYSYRGKILRSTEDYEVVHQFEEASGIFSDAISVRLVPGEKPYFCISGLLAYQGGRAAGFESASGALYIYNSNKELVYHEVVAGWIDTLGKAPGEANNQEVLLVAGGSTVWKYTLPKKPVVESRELSL
jgi:hypothetical protein